MRKNMTEEDPFPRAPFSGFPNQGRGFVIGPLPAGGRGSETLKAEALGAQRGRRHRGRPPEGVMPPPGPAALCRRPGEEPGPGQGASSKVLPWLPTSTSREPLVSCWLEPGGAQGDGPGQAGPEGVHLLLDLHGQGQVLRPVWEGGPGIVGAHQGMTWAVFTPSICRTGL